jgi:DNA modification methylase
MACDIPFLNEIVCGDCLELMKRIPDASIELILTDIPYDVVNRKSGGLRNLDKKDADILTFDLEEFINQAHRICKGSIYIFCSTEQVSEIRGGLVSKGMTTRLCIWEKSNPSPMNGEYMWLSGVECCVFGRKKGAVFNEKCKNTVWKFASPKSKVHPTQKPSKLFEYIISVSSNESDTILDPCLGSGTSVIAAKTLGRKFIGIDISQEYCEIARQRIA